MEGRQGKEEGKEATPGAGRSLTPSSPSRLIKALALRAFPLSAFPFDLLLPPPPQTTNRQSAALPSLPPPDQAAGSIQRHSAALPPLFLLTRKPPHAHEPIPSGRCFFVLSTYIGISTAPVSAVPPSPPSRLVSTIIPPSRAIGRSRPPFFCPGKTTLTSASASLPPRP